MFPLPLLREVTAMDENEKWILSFYRSSEITGALFFGRLAQTLKPGPIQRDLTKHFSDESLHAWYWQKCIEDLGEKPLKLRESYQDQYLEAAGLPVNIMEILAITQVFEKRVIQQYAIHSQVPDLHSVIRQTFERIMEDEKWHIEWVGKALKNLESEYGKELIEQTLKRFWKADQEVYGKTINEHEERLKHIVQIKKK